MMIHRSLSYDPTAEHRLTHAKWVRGFAIVYGTILLLLFALIAAQRVTFEHSETTGIADGAAASAAKSRSRISWEQQSQPQARAIKQP